MGAPACNKKGGSSMSLKENKQNLAVMPEEEEEDIDEIEFYWDVHQTRKDRMGESVPHIKLMHYLLDVIEWLLDSEKRVVLRNFSIYLNNDTSKANRPLEPDIAVFKGVELTQAERERLRSWKIGQKRKQRPPPNVVFEFASRGTWAEDLEKKPQGYARLNGAEYFAYDPNTPQYYTIAPVRLKGWRYENGQPVELQPNDQGWLWSNELDSYLVPDGVYLRLYDRTLQLRLTKAEFEQAAKEKAQLAARLERVRAEAERKRADKEKAAKEAERQRAEQAWAKLRELGIDPEKL
jgi:Uma2 family endonuclease